MFDIGYWIFMGNANAEHRTPNTEH
jgi:hypothetical protein